MKLLLSQSDTTETPGYEVQLKEHNAVQKERDLVKKRAFIISNGLALMNGLFLRYVLQIRKVHENADRLDDEAFKRVDKELDGAEKALKDLRKVDLLKFNL